MTHTFAESEDCPCNVGCLGGKLMILERNAHVFQHFNRRVADDGRIDTMWRPISSLLLM